MSPEATDRGQNLGDTMLLNLFLDDFYFAFRPSLSARTIKLYRHSVKKFGQFVGVPPGLSDLTNSNVGKYLAAISASGLAPATVEKERSQLLAIWRDAQLEGLIDKGPRVQPIKVPDPVPRSLKVPELQQLWLTFDTLQGKTGGNENSDVIRAAATLQLTTAERIFAVTMLRWDDLDRENNVVTYRAENRKGGRRIKATEVPPAVITCLDRLHCESEFIFAGCQGKTKLSTLYSRAFGRSGIRWTKGKTSHLLRSTKATLVDVAGGNASRSLGHRSPATTERYYIEERIDDTWRLLPDFSDWLTG